LNQQSCLDYGFLEAYLDQIVGLLALKKGWSTRWFT